MRPEFFDVIRDQTVSNHSYCVATVIKVEGSASARTGSRAVFDATGKNIFGWVGGGCAERFVGENAVEALSERKTRIVTADLDDEIFGLGIACGGRMDVFIEPIFPADVLILPRLQSSTERAEFLAKSQGWTIQWSNDSRELSSLEDLLLLLSESLAKARGRTPESLRNKKDLPVQFQAVSRLHFNKLSIVGRGRISESLARWGALVGWSTSVFGPGVRQEDYPSSIQCECLKETYDELTFEPNTAVVVASHHPKDADFVKRALEAGASYVGMIGSRKRALEVLEKLDIQEGEKIEKPLFVPAGLDIDARTPEEIGLSLIAELILLKEN